MSKDEQPRILIDRYGSPLGTPPEIYRDCVENGKNEINHGNIPQQNKQNNDQMPNNNYYETHNEFYENEQKQNPTLDFNNPNEYMNYDMQNINSGYPEQQYSQEYDYSKQPIYNNQDQYYDPEQYDFSNYKQHPAQMNKYQNQQPYYDNYDYDCYVNNGEQPLYVNIKQFHCIRKRKLRRDFLDTLMKQPNTPGYLHESRHRHAMNRVRAPSGRFLTKEETAERRKINNENGENGE